jgi:hypothetical protein
VYSTGVYIFFKCVLCRFIFLYDCNSHVLLIKIYFFIFSSACFYPSCTEFL